MTERLKGKVAVVTGAGRGIGRAYAHALAREGASIVVNDIPGRDDEPSEAEQVAVEIQAFGGQAVPVHDSVADFAGAGRTVAVAVDTWGRLDILIANAGNMRPVPLLGADELDWSAVISVHVNGTFNCIRHAAPLMMRAGGGSIVTTGDITTDLLFPRLAAYRSAKAAIAVLTLHAAEEFRDLNINVNSIMPGATATKMAQHFFDSLGDERADFLERVRVRYEREEVEQAPTATPDMVPPLGVYLCTDGARHITGCLFQTAGTSFRLVTPVHRLSVIQPDEERWTTEALIEVVPPWVSAAAEVVAR